MAKIALPFPIPREWGPSTAQAIEDNLQRMFSSSGRIGQGGSTLVNGLDLIVPAVGDLIVCTSAGIFVVLPIVTTAQRSLTNNGGIPTWALIDLTNGITGALPLANLVHASATQIVLGRNSAGAGVYEEVTATQLLDWIGGTQGDVLFRGAAGWQALAPGTAGRFLQTGGAAADVAWAVPSGSGGINDLIAQQFYELHGRPTTLVPMGIAAVTVAGTLGVTQLNYPAGSTVQLIQTNTTLDLRCGIDSGRFDMHEVDSGITFEIVLRTGATMTNIRMWMALSAASMSTSADDEGGTTKYIAFRYSTVAGDGGWVGVLRDGTTQHVTGTVATIGASTQYKLKIRIAGGTAFFSVDGGAEVSSATNIPAAGTALGFSLQVFNAVAGSTHPWEFSRLRAYYGS